MVMTLFNLLLNMGFINANLVLSSEINKELCYLIKPEYFFKYSKLDLLKKRGAEAPRVKTKTILMRKP